MSSFAIGSSCRLSFHGKLTLGRSLCGNPAESLVPKLESHAFVQESVSLRGSYLYSPLSPNSVRGLGYGSARCTITHKSPSGTAGHPAFRILL